MKKCNLKGKNKFNENKISYTLIHYFFINILFTPKQKKINNIWNEN